MQSLPPRPPTRSLVPGSPRAAERKIAVLRAEIEAQESPAVQAMLHYELGALTQQHLQNDAMAVKAFLTAYNLASGFRPPLFALIDVFERRRSRKNLDRLYAAEARGAPTAEDRASALVDRGILCEDHLGRPEEAAMLYDTALTIDGQCTPAALMLERFAHRSGDPEAVRKALKWRADLTADPMYRSLLLTDLAWEEFEAGNVDEAIDTLRAAGQLGAGRRRALDQLERMARAARRPSDLKHALEAKAELFLAAARGEDTGTPSGAFSVEHEMNGEQASYEAAGLFFEASRVRAGHPDDAEQSARSIARAVALNPDDLLLGHRRLLACEAAADEQALAQEAERLLALGTTGRFASPLRVRLAEVRHREGDSEGALAALFSAREEHPESAAIDAYIHRLLLERGEPERQIALLQQYAAGEQGVVRARALWQAAHLAARVVKDFELARPLYLEAAECMAATRMSEPGPTDETIAIRRELYSEAWAHGQLHGAREALESLLQEPLPTTERGALLFELYRLLQHELGDHSAAQALLTKCVIDPDASQWAPHLARMRTASEHSYRALARTHQALAQGDLDDDARDAHLCAASRALICAGDEDGAIAELRTVLDRSPGQRYAVALLEELLRARGEADEVVTLLRDAAVREEGARAAEIKLLLAGAAAEASGDMRLAAETYEEAADRDPTAFAPLWSLRRLAERTHDTALLLRTREALSDREVASGEPGATTLELAEHYDLIAGKSELAEAPLRTALTHPEVGLAAATHLLLLPSDHVEPAARIEALQTLAGHASGPAHASLLRTMGEESLTGPPDVAATDRLANTLLDADPEDRWACWARLLVRRAQGDEQGRAEGWLALGRATSDPLASAELLLQGLRAQIVAEGREALDDAFLVAQELAAGAPETAAAGVALDETLTAGDDAEARTEALRARLPHTGTADQPPLQAALGRALLAAGRSSEALDHLSHVVRRDPDDLASWEAVRVAAREENAWEQVVEACDRLSSIAKGSHRAMLLEEAAVVLVDQLARPREGESRLQAALEQDVQRPLAFGRLHDLLAARDDTQGLLQLVTRRVEASEDDEQWCKWSYEHARLLRAHGDRDTAVAVLVDVLRRDPRHVGALALRVEIDVSNEQWSDAVVALQQLASCDVPPAQQRLARIGAADFLDKHLDNSRGALAELRHVVELGLADAVIYARMAQLAESIGDLGEAVSCLTHAAGASQGPAVAEHERRAGELLERMGQAQNATQRYRNALTASPTDLDAAEALARLVVNPAERNDLAEAFAREVRLTLEEGPLEPGLRKLLRSSSWIPDPELHYRVLNALTALEFASPEERQEHETLAKSVPSRSPAPPPTASIDRIRPEGPQSPMHAWARLLEEGAADFDPFELDRYGVGKAHLVNPKKPHAVREELVRWASVLGATVDELYVGPTQPDLVLGYPARKGRCGWVIGTEVATPFTAEQRFAIGRWSMALREHTYPFTRRTVPQTQALFVAAAQAVDVALAPPDQLAALQAVSQDLARRLPRRVRKALPDVVRAVGPDPAAIAQWAEAARRATLRAGLMLAGSLDVALDQLSEEPAASDAQALSDEARHLVCFWVSETAQALRREMGAAQ